MDEAALEKLADHLVQADHQFKDDLRTLRTTAGLTQEIVAERMGCSVGAVQNFEAYWSNPPLSDIRRYALAIGVAYEHRFVPLPD